MVRFGVEVGGIQQAYEMCLMTVTLRVLDRLFLLCTTRGLGDGCLNEHYMHITPSSSLYGSAILYPKTLFRLFWCVHEKLKIHKRVRNFLFCWYGDQDVSRDRVFWCEERRGHRSRLHQTTCKVPF